MTSTIEPSFSTWLRRRRRAYDLTQAELASEIGCSTVLIAKLEAGDRRPSRQIAALLAARLGVPPHQRAEFVAFARSEVVLTAPLTPAGRQSPGRLPPPHIQLHGRSAELDRIGALLAAGAHLITISGPGGVGKTSLALEAAHRYAPADGAFFVPLAPVERPDLLAGTVTAALHIASGNDALAALLAHLRDKQVLLVLDNLEHLLSDDPDGHDPLAELMTTLLAGAPGVGVLATSRERLNLRSEWVLDLAGIGEAADANAGEAVALFTEHAQRLLPDFAPGPSEQATIAAICQDLGGLPLAIELAASWISILSLGEIAAELRRSPDFLESQARDRPRRHRSVRLIFDQSWALLDPSTRQVLAGLALFQGGFTRDAALAIARAGLPHIAALQQKSLLRRASNGRYDLHPLVRYYSRERLAASSEQAEYVRRYIDYCLALATQAGEAIRGPHQIDGLATFTHEHDNLRAALDLGLREGAYEKVARLCTALSGFWRLRAHYREGLGWIERVLDAPDLSDDARANLLESGARIASMISAVSSARAFVRQAAELRRASGDEQTLAHVTFILGEIEVDLLEHEAARKHLSEALALYERLGDASSVALVRNILANTLYDLGRGAEAAALHRAALADNRARADISNTAITLCNMGLIAVLEDQAEAAQLLSEALSLFQQLGYQAGLVFVLEGLAAAAGRAGLPELGGQLLGASAALRAALALPVSPSNQAYYVRLEALARGTLSDEAFASALAAGRDTESDSAIALALGWCRPSAS